MRPWTLVLVVLRLNVVSYNTVIEGARQTDVDVTCSSVIHACVTEPEPWALHEEVGLHVRGKLVQPSGHLRRWVDCSAPAALLPPELLTQKKELVCRRGLHGHER